MRYKSIALKGYIGIYNGLLVNSISIDFDKCIHNMIVIKGDTGSGKSTLFKALTPLPDQSSDFIPGSDAVKTLEIMHEGFYYLIEYVHAWKGNAFVSKGAFYKGTCKDDMVLCNPNLNITACKDLVFSEFNLDPAFLELTELSATNRGIITSTPALRRQNFNSIISGVEIYNQMYKTLNKRSAVFKSMINSLSTKIKSIGNEQLVKSSITSSKQRIAIIQATIEEYIAKIAQAEGVIARLDPDGKIQETYDKSSIIYKDYTKLVYGIVNKYPDAIYDPVIIKSDLTTITEKIQQMTTERDDLKRDISRLLSEANEQSEKLNTKRAKLDSLVSDSNYDDMLKAKSDLIASIKEIEEFLVSNNISIDYSSISSSEYIAIMGVIETINNAINKVIAEYPQFIRTDIANSYFSSDLNKSLLDDIASAKHSIAANDIELASINQALTVYENDKKISDSILANRPDDCTNDKCPYITKGVELRRSMITESEALTMQESRNLLIKSNDEYSAKIVELELALAAKRDIDQITYTINTQSALLQRAQSLGSNLKYVNIKSALKIIEGNITVKIDPNMYNVLSNVSVFDTYKTSKENLRTVETNLSIFEAKHELIDEIMEDITRLENVVTNLHKTIDSHNEEISSLDRCLVTASQMKTEKEAICQAAVEVKQTNIRINELKADINRYRSDIEEINAAKTTISVISSKLTESRQQLEIFTKELAHMEYAMSRLEEYQEELVLFEAKYDKIDFMKKCCSPTKSGIQNIFIALYLNDIIRTANKLLSMVFSSMTLQQPVINDRVFSFPCIGEGLPHDDVSSLSGGQSAIMSVVLSGSIMYHSSTKYNILKLDEVDAQLDSTLRPQFLPLIGQVRSILGCEQCFIISHNEALDLRNTDLIIFKTSDPDIYNSGANIIFKS